MNDNYVFFKLKSKQYICVSCNMSISNLTHTNVWVIYLTE